MASSDAPPPDAEMRDADAPSASILGTDELRCIFAALLTTREPAKDLGRCAWGARTTQATLACRVPRRSSGAALAGTARSLQRPARSG